MKIMIKKHTDDRKKLIRLVTLVFVLCFFVLKSNAQSIAGSWFVQPGLPDRADFFLRDSKNYLWVGPYVEPTGDEEFKLKDKSASEIHKSISDNNLVSSGSNLQGKNTEALTKEPSQYDDLIVLLNTTKDDSVKAGIYTGLCWNHRYDSLALSINYGTKALEIYKKQNNLPGQCDVLNKVGVAKRCNGRFIDALEDYYMVLSIAQKPSCNIQIAYAYNNIGDIFFRLEKYDEANSYANKSLAINRLVNYKEGEAYNFLLLGNISDGQKRWLQSIGFYKQALNIRLDLGDSGIAPVYEEIGDCFMELNLRDSALTYYNKARVFGGESFSGYYLGLGRYYNSNKQYKQAISYLKRGIELSPQKNLQERISAYNLLSQIYFIIHNYETAYLIQSKAVTLNESLKGTNNVRKMTQIQMSYYFGQKLKLKEIEEESRKKLYESKIERQRTTSIFLFIFLLAISAVVILVVRSSIYIKKTNRLLEEKNNEINNNNISVQKSYSLLNATLESTADGILVVDRAGKITNLNGKFIELWGIPEEIISSHDYKQAIAFVLSQLKDPESFLAKIEELYSDDLATSFDVLEFKDGRTFERYSQPQLYEGKNVGRVWSFRDITLKKQSIENLERERYLLRTIMDNIPDAVYFKDTESRFLRINKAHARLFGLNDPSEAIGKTDNDYFSSVHAQEAFNDEQEIIKTGIPVIGKEEMETWTDRPSRWVSTTKMPFVDAKDNIIGVFGISRDITDHKKAEESLRRSEAEFKKLNAAKDKFFSIIAHDLRSPFSGFMGLTEIMAGDLSGFTKEQIHELAVNMKNSAKVIYNLLENLLQWARLQQDSVAFNVQLLQLHQIVAECVAISAESARKKDIELAFNVPDDLTVLADSNILQTIIRNLVSNALKFTLRNGQVTITAKAIDKRDVEVAVKDTGIGMSSTMVNNLFRLDVKTNREGTEGESSSGLGLVLCKEFVEKLGGKLWVESEEGTGTTFYFSLHRQPNTTNTVVSSAGQVVSENKPTVDDEVDLSGKRVLVVDDNQLNVKVAVLSLKKHTQYAYSAVNGLEAVDVFTREKPDIILMDMHMPEMDGIEATLKIREIEKQRKTEKPVTIISMWATTSDEDIQKCMDAGMDASLEKPFKVDALVGVLNSLGIN